MERANEGLDAELAWGDAEATVGTETPPPADRRPPRRPLALTLVAALAFVSGALNVSLGALGLVDLFFGEGSQYVVAGLIVGAMGVVTLGFALGAWRLRPWAWIVGVILFSISLGQAVLVLGDGIVDSNLLVAPLCLAYLLWPSTRALFRRPPTGTRQAGGSKAQ